MSIFRCAFFLSIATLLACTDVASPATGTADVTLTVSGLDVEPDGYQIMVDGSDAATIAGQGSVAVHLLVGQHSITLGGLASNCALQLPVIQRVTVSQGETVRLDFAVICGALTGVVKVTAVTTGLDPDPDGYQVAVGGAPVQLLSNGATWITNVQGGAHSLSISGVAPNCTVGGSNPVPVNVSVGGLVRDTAVVALNLTCTAATGVIEATAATTGLDPDTNGYSFAIDGTRIHAVTSNGTSAIPSIPGGTHNVTLLGIADNCTVAGSNPMSASVTVGGATRDTARVTFNVTCTKIPPSGADFIVTTTGANQDNSYYITLNDTCDYYCDPWWQGSVPGNGTVAVDLPAGNYSYGVSDIAGNCSGPTSGSFDVTAQHVTSVPLAFTCVATGTVVAGVQASGTDVQTHYGIVLDGAYQYLSAAGGHVSFDVTVGTHSIGLPFVNANCTVAAPNPVSVTVRAGTTTNVNFAVTCVANPILRVTVATTGANAPANYLVGVDPDYYYGYSFTAPVPSNASVSITLPPGGHVVTLDQVPLNCTVTSANNVYRELSPGITTDLAFSVTCH